MEVPKSIQNNPKCLSYLRKIIKECQVPAVSRPFVSGCMLDIHQTFKLPQAANIRLTGLRILLTSEDQHISTTLIYLACVFGVLVDKNLKDMGIHGTNTSHGHQRPRPMTPGSAPRLPFLSLLRSNARVPLPSVPVGCEHSPCWLKATSVRMHSNQKAESCPKLSKCQPRGSFFDLNSSPASACS